MITAWRLSDNADIGQITLYQRGWRLGGKGASSRGKNARIEEHGLHVWLGYYDNAFRAVREVYAELDRQTNRPDCPIARWDDAFSPAPHVGLATRGDHWDEWTALFTPNDLLPGEPDAESEAMGPEAFVRRAMRLVADYLGSLDTAGARRAGRVTLSTRPDPPRSRVDLAALLTQTVDAVTAVVYELTNLSLGVVSSIPGSENASVAIGLLESLRSRARTAALATTSRRRVFELIDIVVTTVRGIIADELLTDPRGFDAIDDEDYTDWLRRHGAADDTFDSPLVTGIYDLVFGYQDGDPDRRRFAAGTGVFLGAKLFFDYRGSIFWKMQVGMGEAVFAPMYEALRDRGVRFEFFHQVDELEVGSTGSHIDAVRMTRQVELADGLDAYEPLASFGGVPCFPAEPDDTQLACGVGHPADLERLWDRDGTGTPVVLRRGDDFDAVVYGISVGMVPFNCGQLVERDQRWRDMATHLGTAATQAFQLWLHDDEKTLGWRHAGSTVTGFVKPFDTIASMSHLLEVEGWPSKAQPGSVMYFCNTLPEPPPNDATHAEYPVEQHRRVRSHAVSFLDQHVGELLPGACTSTGFDWDQLVGAGELVGEERFDSQFWTANVDPSDRYVQSLPGTSRYRLRPDQSGFENLYLAGDWTDCGVNAGCIEAAVISGLQAANAMTGRTRWSGISGDWEPLGER